ncbi:SRPBCC family protein [Nakamurella alba]|nr:SRPBCC family protein [Nakamurella alba]
MVVITSSVEVAADFRTVAALVLDWGRDAEWRTVLDVRTTPPGPAVLGQQIVERLRFAGLVFETPTVIKDVARLSGAVRITYAGGSSSVTVSGSRAVHDLGGGRCRIDTRLELALRGLLRQFTRMLAPSYRRRSDADLRRAAMLLERAATPTGSWGRA